MKSLHDYRGEYRAARKRYGRAWNRWGRAKPYTPQKYALATNLEGLCKAMFDARDRYCAALKSKVST